MEQLTTLQVEYLIGSAIGFVACALLIIILEKRRK